MAHLMGFLLGASAEKIRNMARFWLTDADAEPRTLVSRLYDEMTDEYAVKSVLERLPPPKELVLTKLTASSKGWVQVKDLVAILPFSEEEIEQILADLEDAGIITVDTVRVFGNEILDGPGYFNRGKPSIQTTVARVPQDLLRIFRRIKQQMSVGDQSDKTLHKFLGELDLPQLQLISERWHLPDAQQRFKKELMMFLETTLSQPQHVNDALVRLGEDAHLVFKTVKDAGGRMALSDIRESLPLGDQSLKQAISSLSSLFLVQETYIGAERYVFIPVGVGTRDALPIAPCEANALSEMPEPSRVFSVDYSFFFDLLALLNYFEHHRVDLTVIERKIPRRVTAEVREQLTIGGKNGHSSARLDYLFHVAKELKLLETRGSRVLVNPKVSEWAELGIVGQAEELFRLWIADDMWKGPNPILSAVANDRLCGEMRRCLVNWLRRCQPGKWYSFDSAVACVAADLGLHESIPQSPSSSLGAAPLIQSSQAEAHGQTVNIVRLFQWMSFLSVGVNNGGSLTAIQLTPLGGWLFGCEGVKRPEHKEPCLNIGPNFEVMMAEPDTLSWYYLLKFTLTVSVGRASVHQITKRKVQQAVYWGAGADQLLAFLRERSRDGIPDNVAASIDEWSKSVKIVNLEKLTILEVDTQHVMEELLACPKYSRLVGRRISPTAVVIQDVPDVKKLMKEMRSDGFFPRLDY